jgi:hypothetical protein
MTRTLACALTAALLTILTPANSTAQDVSRLEPGDEVLEVRLSDGSVLYGRVAAVEGERVTIETTGGAMVVVDRARIVSATSARGVVRNGRVGRDDGVTDRLFATPTGRTLPRGTGHAGFQELLFPYASYGIVDRLQVTAGTTILPEIFGRLWYVAPKVGIVSTPEVQVAAGAAAFFLVGEDLDGDDDGFGLVHGSVSLGRPGRSLTVAGALPFLYSGSADDNLEFGEEPLILAGGELRVHPAVTLVTDNAFVPSASGAILAGGMRVVGGRLSADLGLSALVDGSDWTCCVPVVNVQWSFGGP